MSTKLKWRCDICGSRDIQPNSYPGEQIKRYKARKCRNCGNQWSEGHRGYTSRFKRYLEAIRGN